MAVSKGTVYLAGPITGLAYGAATDWREAAEKWLRQYDIEGLSPMRGKQYLETELAIADSYDGVADWPLSMAPGFTGRDRRDCMTADIVLANFAGAEAVSIGTVMECAWADVFRRQLIVVLDVPDESEPPRGSSLSVSTKRGLHDHAMIRQVAGYIVTDLAQALALCPPILNAGYDWERTEHHSPYAKPFDWYLSR